MCVWLLIVKQSASSPNTASPASESESAAASTTALMSRIAELQHHLLSTQYESSVLREQLVVSQVELSQLKDRGLVQATLKTTSAAASAAASRASATVGQSPPSGGQPVLQLVQQLQQLQHQHQQQHQQQPAMPAASSPSVPPMVQKSHWLFFRASFCDTVAFQAHAGNWGGGFGGASDGAFRVQLDYAQLKSKLRPTGVACDMEESDSN